MDILGGPSNDNKDFFNLPLPYHLTLVIWLLYGLGCVRAFGNEVVNWFQKVTMAITMIRLSQKWFNKIKTKHFVANWTKRIFTLLSYQLVKNSTQLRGLFFGTYSRTFVLLFGLRLAYKLLRFTLSTRVKFWKFHSAGRIHISWECIC